MEVATEIHQGLAAVADALAVHRPLHWHRRRGEAVRVQRRKNLRAKDLGQRLVVEQELRLARRSGGLHGRGEGCGE